MKFRTINIGFTYDVDGLRTSKTIPNVGLEHKYYYVGDRLQYETLGGSSALWYFYDADGNPSGIRYKDHSGTVNDYYFVCNWCGDVIQIYNASGTLVGSYNYDAWGKVTENATSADTQNITETNPIRYRGYYYDTETRLYYLKSRYYDPAVKRFINGDKLLCTTEQLGFNLYAYCYNNPVINIDPSGKCAYKANSYDFYRANHGLPAAECKCNLGKTLNSTKISKNESSEKGYYHVEINTNYYSKLSKDEALEYSQKIAKQIQTLSLDQVNMTLEQQFGFYQEAELHKYGYLYGFGKIKERCEVTDIIIYYDGEVVDGRWYVDDVKKFIF